MTTLNIELPDEAVRVAGRRGTRVDGERDEMGYPLGWFERTCGALADVEDFREPADPI